MVKKQNTQSNLLFQTIYQVVILIVPLMVSPYLTRVLGGNALGIHTHINSIAYYFVIFANLGILKYGQRVIAEVRNNELELRQRFWSLYANHVGSSVLAITLYSIFLCVATNDNHIIYMINFIYVFSSALDITWLFYGLENFKSVAIKNACIQLINMGCIFIFVKTPNDLWKYTLIICASALISQLLLVPQAIRIVKPIKVTRREICSHTKPLLMLFISVIAITLYTVFDKTLLGILSTKESVAYYEYSNKIINIPKVLISIVSTLLFPKICYLVNSGRNSETQRYVKLSIAVTSMLAIGAIFGLFAIAEEFSIYYYGEDFAETGKIMCCMAPLIYILTIGDVIRLQYMIPFHKDKAYIICACANAVVNLVLSTLLIPSMGVYGAVVGSLGAEVFGLIYQMIYSRKFIPVKMIVQDGLPFLFMAILMFGEIKLLSKLLQPGLWRLIIEAVSGGLLYLILAGVYLIVFSKDRNYYKKIVYSKLKKGDEC